MEGGSGSIPATGVSETNSLEMEASLQTNLTQTNPETKTASANPEKQPEPAKKKKRGRIQSKVLGSF